MGAAFRRLISAAGLCLAASVVSPAKAPAEENERLALKCVGEIAYGQSLPAVGSKLSFATEVPFGEGRFLALADPETGHVEKLVYAMEALTGSFQIENNPAEMIVWTLATSRKGGFVGQVIGSDGQILTLTIENAPAGAAERPFVLFGAASGGLYRGNCL